MKLSHSRRVTLVRQDGISVDNMAKAIEMHSMEAFVRISELMKDGENCRAFNYKLNDRAAKNKLIKGAKRIPFEVVEKNFLFKSCFQHWSLEQCCFTSCPLLGSGEG